MTPDPDREALAQLRLRYRVAAAAADAFFEEGFTVVLEDVIAGHLLPAHIELIHSRPLHVVVLIPSIETVTSGGDARNGNEYSHYSLQQLHSDLVEATPRLGLWLDNSEQTPEQTVDAILAATEQKRGLA